MTDYGHDLLFGYFLTPDAGEPDMVLELARFADRLGLDLLGVQDHPYQPRLLDMWTLLSTVAAQTQRIRLLPDVANLPLRLPAVLAHAAASLDILSGGRVELGLGSGAFPRAVHSIGGPERAPRDAVDALDEAITVIRSLWTPGQRINFEGKHYSLREAQPGPFPPHPIGIWLGSYKPRMLRLTGRMADGWIPTLAYAAPEELSPMTRIIDDAARDAGRDPSAIRRAYNISGRFSDVERGYLDGPPELWVAQLTDLVLEYGISAFLLAPGEDPAGDLEWFATEVAPGVREAVASLRRGEVSRPVPQATLEAEPVAPATTVAAARPAPTSPLLRESERPHVTTSSPREETPIGRASAQTLIGVHEHLRQELAEIQRIAAAVAGGRMSPAAARSVIERMTIRQSYWTFGSFCAQYCRVVTVHHTIEDRLMFPALRHQDEALSAVLDRLGEEHEIIAAVLDRFDRSLVEMMDGSSGVERVRQLVDELGDALLSHLAYEENELLGPLARSNIRV